MIGWSGRGWIRVYTALMIPQCKFSNVQRLIRFIKWLLKLYLLDLSFVVLRDILHGAAKISPFRQARDLAHPFMFEEALIRCHLFKSQGLLRTHGQYWHWPNHTQNIVDRPSHACRQ